MRLTVRPAAVPRGIFRKPENGNPDDVSPAARIARALAAVCISCGALIAPAAAMSLV